MGGKCAFVFVVALLFWAATGNAQAVAPSTAPPNAAKLSSKDFTYNLGGSAGDNVLSNANGKLQQVTPAQEPALAGKHPLLCLILPQIRPLVCFSLVFGTPEVKTALSANMSFFLEYF